MTNGPSDRSVSTGQGASTEQGSAVPPAARADVWTYRKILDWTQQRLKDCGAESPRVEAEVLLAHAAGCQRILLYTRLDEPTPEAVRGKMRDLVQRRVKFEPVAYLVGHREFFSLDFDVSRAVLVPRPETESLVMAALDRMPSERPGRVLEIGVGSGCVSVAIAHTRKNARIVAVDISQDALQVAQRNVAKHRLSDRIELRQGSCYEAVVGEMFDLIVSNPPYIRIDEMPGLQADVRLHEPELALVAGDDGLDVVRTLVAEGRNLLREGGSICLEIDPAQVPAVTALFQQHGWGEVVVMKDCNGDERVICAKRDAATNRSSNETVQ